MRGSRKTYFKHSSNIRSLFDLEVNTFQPNMYLIKVSNMTIIEKVSKIYTVMNETKNKGEFKLNIYGVFEFYGRSLNFH